MAEKTGIDISRLRGGGHEEDEYITQLDLDAMMTVLLQLPKPILAKIIRMLINEKCRR